MKSSKERLNQVVEGADGEKLLSGPHGQATCFELGICLVGSDGQGGRGRG